jgi:hypothetical protein
MFHTDLLQLTCGFCGGYNKFHRLDYNALQLVENRALLAACVILVSCLAYSSTLKMETCSSETSDQSGDNIDPVKPCGYYTYQQL